MHKGVLALALAEHELAGGREQRRPAPAVAQLDARAQYLQELRLEVALESAALPLTVLTGLDGGVKLREARLVPLEEVFRMIEAMPMRRWEQQRTR